MYKKEEQLIVLNADDYIPAYELAIGVAEPLVEDGIPIISFVFYDADNQPHVILMHPRGDLVRYFLSEDFRDYLSRLIAEVG